jgi:uncharacterized membrane protein YbhN (UPF0104 family)
VSPRSNRKRIAHPAWLWLGLVVTAVAVYWTLRDVNVSLVVQSARSASLTALLGVSVMQLLGIFFRGVRWRYLTSPLADYPLPLAAHVRATAVGFMAINLLPFRIGELIRPWFLARQTGIRGTAALGTIVLERALDFAALAIIGGTILYFHSGAFPPWFRTGAYMLAGISMLPISLLVALWIDEERTMSVLTRAVRPLPGRLRAGGLDLITELCRGLGTLRGPKPLAVVLLYTALIWGVIYAAPFAFGLLALDVQLPPGEWLLAIFTLHAFTALAVAAPSAPGFLGVYHVACKEALALFGVAPEVAVAFGTLVHLAYWIPVTLAGALVVARAGTSLTELTSQDLGKARSEPHR